MWIQACSRRAELNGITRISYRLLLTLFLALAWAGEMSVPAAARQFSAIAVDAKSGKVLFARDPDGIRYPASLTKVMTLYLLFEEMKAGRVSRDTGLPVSRYAASRSPSKLGLKPGSTIRAEDAIKALCTKSANDVASVIAEALAGSESAFAERMTRTARRLGMTRTTFRNASGLPHPKQVTTARDMATLALRIQRDFPEYYRYFSLSSFTYKGRTYRNHNRLLNRLDGMDGIKTGYIHASGFNLTSSVERDGKRVVGVVIGGKTAASRNNYMASMIEKLFKSAQLKSSGAIAALAGDPPGHVRTAEARIASLPLPRAKPELGDGKPDETAEVATLEGEGDDSEGGEPAVGGAPAPAVAMAVTGTTVATVSAEDALELAGKAGEASLPLPAAGAKSDPLIVAAASPDEVEPEAPQQGSGWTIQIGAFPTREGAASRLDAAKSAGIDLLDGKGGFITSVQKKTGVLYRARFSGLTERAARDACKLLNRKGMGCFALAPQS